MKDDIKKDVYEEIRVMANDMQAEFQRILVTHGFDEEKARSCAEVFTQNSVDGIYTHGVNRFPRFIEYVSKGYVQVNEEPVKLSAFGSMEQWNGNLGPGPLNAIHATERAMEISKTFGMGCVAMRNTNHWMRGGLYGWKAAKAGFMFIGWSNTIANMPAWGASDSRLGNNPLVMAVPYQDEAIVLDMAMSQYSFGAMELQKNKNEQLAVAGGFDQQGNLTKDPVEILKTQRGLPIGYWKGAGLAFVLDIIATVLSGGDATRHITAKGIEYGVSQVFIAINLSALNNYDGMAGLISGIIEDYHQSVPLTEKDKIIYPGERVIQKRRDNLEKGVPVGKKIWEEIKRL